MPIPGEFEFILTVSWKIPSIGYLRPSFAAATMAKLLSKSKTKGKWTVLSCFNIEEMTDGENKRDNSSSGRTQRTDTETPRGAD